MEARLSCRWPRIARSGLVGMLAAFTTAAASPGRADIGSEPPPDRPTVQLLEGPAATFTAADRARRLVAKGMTSGSAVMIRIFKGESELELWMQKDGRFELFATYPICYWSGRLGPKQREGDRQAPEGFYTVSTQQLHRQGRHPRSLDLGFPNTLDRAQARSGSYILLHGGCRSIGCYAMTNAVMDEIYALSEQALRQGQERIQVHVFPFRMTEDNLKVFADHKWYDFWLNLKDAYDMFERTHVPPRVGVCERKYMVSEGVPPGEEAALAATIASSPLSICERDEAEAALWQLPVAQGAHYASSTRARSYRRHARRFVRNARKAYAAAHRARLASYAAKRAH